MTQNPKDTEQELAAFFAAEAARENEPSAALMDAILRDAETLQPRLAGLPKPAPQIWSFKRDLWDALGGWGMAGTLSACLLLGVSLGFTPPDRLDGLAETVLQSTGLFVAEDDYIALFDIAAEG